MIPPFLLKTFQDREVKMLMKIKILNKNKINNLLADKLNMKKEPKPLNRCIKTCKIRLVNQI